MYTIIQPGMDNSLINKTHGIGKMAAKYQLKESRNRITYMHVLQIIMGLQVILIVHSTNEFQNLIDHDVYNHKVSCFYYTILSTVTCNPTTVRNFVFGDKCEYSKTLILLQFLLRFLQTIANNINDSITTTTAHCVLYTILYA